MDLNSSSAAELPRECVCPITHELMRDPVVAADGNSYERAAIEAWLGRGARTSPLTNLPLPHVTLIPNLALWKVIEDAERRMPESQRRQVHSGQGAGDLESILDGLYERSTGSLGKAPAACRWHRAGWMQKQSKHMKRWHRRWVVLGPTALETFRSEPPAGALTESFALHKIHSAQADLTAGEAHMRLHLRDGRQVLFTAESAGDATVWADRIALAASEIQRRSDAKHALAAASTASDMERALAEAREVGMDEAMLNTYTAQLADLRGLEAGRVAEAERRLRAAGSADEMEAALGDARAARMDEAALCNYVAQLSDMRHKERNDGAFARLVVAVHQFYATPNPSTVKGYSQALGHAKAAGVPPCEYNRFLQRPDELGMHVAWDAWKHKIRDCAGEGHNMYLEAWDF